MPAFGKITRLRADLHRVRSAPMLSSKAKELARAQLDQLAQSGDLDVRNLVALGGPIVWAEPGAGRSPPVVDPVAVMAWLFREPMAAAVDREIAAVANDKAALSDKDRAAQIAKLSAAILELERQEEAVIDAAEADGTSIPRRADADPRAILGIATA